jgi:predicted ATPase/DNA-binding CsgD family transcriptional regulator
MSGVPPDAATWIRALREQRRLSQSALARALGVSRLTVLRWENGQALPSPRTWQQFLAAGGDQFDRVQPEAAPPTPHNLPPAPNALIGREEALADVAALLSQSRLVTLTGAGGSGKTRLALAVAAAALDAFPAGVWFADLAPLQSAEFIATTVAAAAGISTKNGEPRQALFEGLREAAALLMIDNCEHLLPECSAFVGALLRACPLVRVLATSRQLLDVDGETLYRVAPLALPPQREHASVEQICTAASVQLFVDRARARESGFRLDEQTLRAIGTVCQRLDGVPLAIELAAAWVSTLSVAEIAAPLDDRLQFLVRGRGDAPDRHRTLRAAIAWGYSLLAEGERAAFDGLSVFPAGFDLAAAETVAGEHVAPCADVLATVAELVDKSLLIAATSGGAARYTMLESLRAFGRERLAEQGQTARVMSRFATHFTERARAARTLLLGETQRDAMQDVAGNLESYRVALEWLAEHGSWDSYLTIAGGIWRYWDTTGGGSEAVYWLERGLRRERAEVHPYTRARALGCLGQSYWRRGRQSDAETLHRRSLDLYRECEDTEGMVWAQTNLGGAAFARSDFATARACWEAALEIGRTRGDRRQIATLLNNLGLVADRQGESEAAEAMLSESAAIRRAIGDGLGLTSSLVNLASLAGRRRDNDTVRLLCAEALALARALGQRLQTGAALEELARADFREGALEQAAVHAHEALELYAESGYRPDEARMRAMLGAIARVAGRNADSRALHAAALTERLAIGDALETADSLLGVAALAADAGEAECAARLLGAVATALRTGTLPPGVEDYAGTLARLRAALPAATLAAAMAESSETALSDVAQAALGWLETAHRTPPVKARPDVSNPRDRATGGPVRLSEQQRKVLGLLATGASNQQIAAALCLSVRTVESHLLHSYGKIGASSRAEAIAYALRHDLAPR